MTRGNGKESVMVSRSSYLLSILDKESDSINQSLAIIEKISKKYNIGISEIGELLQNRERYLAVPVGIFRSSMGPLESVVRYLKDFAGCSFSDMTRLLARDKTTIWTTYQNSLKTGKFVVDLELSDLDLRKFKVKREQLIIPVHIFSERRLSILESLCLYLRETFNLNYHSIGMLLERDERTVWTAVNRAKKKIEGK